MAAPPSARRAAGPADPAGAAGPGAAPVRRCPGGAGFGAARDLGGADPFGLRPLGGHDARHQEPDGAVGSHPAAAGRAMSGVRRNEDEVRRMLETARPQVPAGLPARASRRGARLLRRRRVLRRLWLVAAGAVVVAFTVWAVMVQPWQAPPAGTTPPLDGW
ncbi:hypothetical protein JGS39_18195 [Streptomyces sp. P01-B04]|nr:hypothetical protein [Streptomyces poriferorum]MBW5256572.1 hypothetical protein [Streptomyces poriferorum]